MKAELTASGFEIEIDFSRCGSCGACVAVCPEYVLHLGTVILIADNDDCTGCNCCIITCPADALRLIDYSGENDG